jgi:hypothetical protein
MKKLLPANILIISMIITYNVYSNQKQFNYEHFDVVPDEKTARKIAEDIWFAHYGKLIYKEKPFVVTLRDSSVWVVKGTLNGYTKGGTAYIEIQKSDCKVLKLLHYK